MGWGTLGSQQRIAVLLQLLGGPEYTTMMRKAAASTVSLARATIGAGLASRTASQRTWLQNQALYTLRRYAFYATLAVSALAVGLFKLGYAYLATRDSARAALSPIFSSTQALTDELNYLFKLSKYSPFVLKDMTDALRVMYPALHNAGMGVGDMNSLMLALTNILSASGKTTPAALGRISYAIQHMLNQGRLTGRLVQSLASAGVPVNLLLKQLGVARENISNIARLNISPNSVIAALIQVSKTNSYFKDAAARLALRSFPGMLQVMRDSLSQFMGVFLGGAYNNFKGRLLGLIGPGGIMDQLSKARNGKQGILALSDILTGSSGMGKGVILLVSVLKSLGAVFITSVIPAFVIAAHSLIVFWPILQLLNIGLGFLAKHAWLVKYALVPLAAWFIITHSAMIGMWAISRLLTIATFGLVTALDFETAALKLMYAWDLVVTAATWLFTAGTNAATAATGLLTTALGAERVAAVSAWAATLGPIALVAAGLAIVAGWLYLIITRWKEVKNSFGGLPGAIAHPVREFNNPPPKGNQSFLNSMWFGSGAGNIIPFAAKGGTITHSGSVVVGDAGPELLNLPTGASITPLSRNSVTPIGGLGDIAGGNGQPIVIQLVLDRKIVAEAVAREKQDKEARR